MKKGIAILLALTVIGLCACGDKEAQKEEKKAEAAAAVEEELEEVDMTPPNNLAFDWNGEYLDSTGGQAILTISPNTKRNKGYEILIYIPGGEGSFSTWSCTATYDDSVGGLHYEDCVRTNMDTSETGGVETAYQKGTGVIIPSGDGSDTLLWIDDQERRGVDLRFERMEEE